MSAVLRLVVVGALSTLMACGVRPRAVVHERPATRPSVRGHVPANASSYTVVRGDTLYGIAFRNGLDYRDLARWNDIAAPYTIYPGQRLRVSGTASAATPNVTAAPRPSPIRGPATPRPPTAPSPAARPIAEPAPTTTPAPRTAAQPSAPVTPPPMPSPATTPVIATSASRSVQGIAWRWPTQGQVIARFVAADATKQGIDVAGTSGQAIVAVADGDVVYSGSGLIGYGELIIIRHSDSFLSAYGHNRARLVKEGQSVKAGQQIAEMGRTGAAREMLHFEIRKNGKPVDPLGFLPAR
ncbi:MAG TPA: peptidoglycan DD-metalloendopeptidase family protein [Chiayiivirga sp.]|nr:peptidoglycan DD-metalloendopeptidase family protein [Chiayiivirga sp.]